MTASSSREAVNVAAELQRLLLGSAGIESFLADVARMAAGAVEHALSCGITVSSTRSSRILGAVSGEVAGALDALQYDLGDGPCLHSMRTSTTVRVDDIANDRRWPAFSRRARQEGAGSSVSVPLMIDGRAVGALNLYSGRPHGLTDDDRVRAHQFAAQAVGAVGLARRLEEREERARHLEHALASRSTIDQAIGIVMARTGYDPEQAFGLLRTQSQHTNEKLRTIALDVVTQAIRHR